jgi:hypothetical protein
MRIVSTHIVAAHHGERFVSKVEITWRNPAVRRGAKH